MLFLGVELSQTWVGICDVKVTKRLPSFDHHIQDSKASNYTLLHLPEFQIPYDPLIQAFQWRTAVYTILWLKATAQIRLSTL